MSREILFRGKRTDNGEWINDSETYILDGDGIWLSDEDLHVVTVQEDTVGQYTGLTDKNGVKIYEGDIVRVNLFGNAYYPWKIVYSDKDAAFEFFRYVAVGIYGGKATGHAKMSAYNKSQIEVIGNIHDNPEMLED